MAMNISLIFLMVFITSGCCTWLIRKTIVDFPIDKGEAEKFPWMVLIQPSPAKINFMGSLVHQKVVLTSTFYKYWFDNHEFRAYADCYVEYQENLPFENETCQQSRAIQDFIPVNRIRSPDIEFFIVLLSEPFEITQQVNVINLFKYGNEVDFNDCTIMFYSDVSSRRNNHTIYSQYFVPLSVRLDEKMSVDFNFHVFEGPPFLIDAQNRTYNIREDAEEWSIRLFGSPIMCRNKHNTTQWLQVGISDLFIDKFPFYKTLVSCGSSTKIKVEHNLAIDIAILTSLSN